MRLRFLLILALLPLGCTAAQPPARTPPSPKATSIAGTWTWKQGEERLELTLKQEGASVSGYHSAIGQRGLKADEAPQDGEPSIKGEMKGAVATVTFRTGYPDSNGHGTATLSWRGEFLYWKIVQSKGEHYLPRAVRLRRTTR